ncbi:muscle, skeletal receptor tyrosine-protein kinase-like isoform X2 [Dysidea avara]|uniref:muscle, skeletal receptor tyrosine-protein kinase-like isoform X2 n=1 Tax=Dysidea avara TaxID=196820 RepID=UPI00333096BF
MRSSKLLLCISLLLCGSSYTQETEENAPLFIYATSNDLVQSFQLGSGRIDIVSNGELVSLFDNPKDNLVHIPSAIPIVPVTVLIYVENIAVKFTWTSLDHNILADPVMSIPTSFTFPTCPYPKLVINAYATDKEYEPIVLYIGKQCGPDSPERFVGATEFPHDVLPMLFNGSTPGCFNDTNPPTLNPLQIETSSTSRSPGLVIVITIIPSAALILIVVLVVLLAVWYHHLRVKERIANISIEAMARQFQFTNPLFDRVETQQRSGPHEKEFPSENIKFVRELGEGAFGRVYQGIATNIIEGEDYTIVAVKQLKTDTTMDDNIVGVEFFKEVSFMSKLDHPRIVGLLGVCTITEPCCMIFEYMDLGDLNSYLRSAIGLGPDCDESEKETCFLQHSGADCRRDGVP